MLKNIKSFYFSKILFSYVDERNKLKLVKYNKNLQYYINISIINYKYFTGKHIIYKHNKTGKEYIGYDDFLIYEGGYLKGERSGIGKEYNYGGNLIYQGEFLNGKRNGKGKEYYKLTVIFDGEYLNGKRNGKGKEYYNNGKIKFDGEYLNGKKYVGTSYDDKGNIINKQNNINGEYNNNKTKLNNKFHVKLYKYKFTGELLYSDPYLNDRNIKGKIYDSSNNLIDKLTNGKGIIKVYDENNILKYEGEYLSGKKHGKGKEYYNNGKLKYEGEYLYGVYLKGKFYVNGKLEYEGEYFFNKKWNGIGYDENGNIIYKLKNGKGKVKEYNLNDGKLIFEGEYLNGRKNGKGKDYHFSFGKLKFEGEYKNGKRTGKGKEYYNDGRLMYEGEFFNDEKVYKMKK